MHALMHNIGAYIKAVIASVVTAVTAAGSGDNTEVDGVWIDRMGYNSLSVLIHYQATLAAAKTIAIAANLQDASDSSGTGAADYGDAYAKTVQATGSGGGSTEKGVLKLDFDLKTADRYVRVQFTPDLSASGTDTASLVASIVLGGADSLPAA